MSVAETAAEKNNLLTKETETSETLPFEYQWPQDNAGEYYLLERQVCEFLKEDSLLQKYPEIHSHEVSKEERKLLFEQDVCVYIKLIILAECSMRCKFWQSAQWMTRA